MQLVTSKQKRGLIKLIREDDSEPVNSVTSPFRPPRQVIPQYVKISSTTQTASRYPGSVFERQGNDQTWTELGTCWLEEANGGTLTTGVYYFCRCVGVRAADGLPIFSTAHVTTKAKIIRFTLPSAIARTDASKASCTVNDFWQGADPGATVTVYNPDASSNYRFAAVSGIKGLASYDDIDDKYWIVALDTKATGLHFTLSAGLATTNASIANCTVNRYWGGFSPGSTITLYNPEASTNYRFSGANGAKGYAVYDDTNDKYWIEQMQC